MLKILCEGGNLMKKEIVSAFVMVLLLSVNAMAINDQSLKGENTFGLL